MRDLRGEVERRLRSAGLDGSTERDIADELVQHVEDRFDELRARGVPADVARAQALEELDEDGGVAERLRGTLAPYREPLALGGGPKGDLAGWWSDLRFGARMLVRSPLYAIIALLVIAFGIGANTLFFTALDIVLLRPPGGVRQPDRLVAVFTSDYSGPRFGSSSYPDYEAIRDDNGVFEAVAVHGLQTVGISEDGTTTRAMLEFVSANYFEVLGVSPVAGRFFAADEGDPKRPASVAVIGDDLWNSHFGRDALAIGATLRLKGQPFTVIGVAPPEFSGSTRGLRVQVWVPVSAPSGVTGQDVAERGNRGMAIIGRMGPGVDVESVQARLDVLASRLHREFPDEWTDVNERSRVFTAAPEREVRVPRVARGTILGFMALLMGAVLTVLLIGCTNVANLVLTRASTRRAEMGIRLALGATRARIVRHLLAESLVLAGFGGIAGVLLAVWVASAVRSIGIRRSFAVTEEFTLDWRVLGFAALLTLLTGLLVGLAPAFQASRSIGPMMKDSASGRVRMRMRHALVVFQVASSLVLLVAGSVFLRSLQAAQRIDSGFDVDGVIVTRFDVGPASWTDEQSAAFHDELLRRAEGLPGATAVALAENVPLGNGWSRRSIYVEGYEPEPGESLEVMNNLVTPGYFEIMGIRPRLGRTFTPDDRPGSPPVVIVTEAFARRFWPSANPIGKRIGIDRSGTLAEVVGMMPDARYRSLVEDPQPYVYYPYLQGPAPGVALLVRSTANPELVRDGLATIARSLAAELPPPTILTFRQHMADAAIPQRVAAALLSGLGLFAIAIAWVGLYGLIAFGVAQRSREFGIRMALGALSGDVRRLVLAGAVRPVLIGIAFGVPVAAGVAFFIRHLLVVQPIDPVAFIGVPLLFAGCALLAAVVPARRAIRQDPAAALRAE